MAPKKAKEQNMTRPLLLHEKKRKKRKWALDKNNIKI
jgi:hypothetical protein